MKILVIGLGSIGKKHRANLELMGYGCDTCDPVQPDSTYNQVSEIENIATYDLVIVCTPISTHLEMLHFLNNMGVKYILMEKPLCSLPTTFQLNHKIPAKELKSKVFINHAYRFERGILKLKELCEHGVAGEIDHVFMENWYSFDKMHPTYNRDKFEGVIYDDSHIINTSRFLWGEPKEMLTKDIRKFKASFDWVTDKGIEVSHTTIETSTRYKKRIEVIGSKGNLIYNFKAHEIFFAPADESERVAIPYKHSCHLSEALRYVLWVVENGLEFKENDIFDAHKDMEVISWLSEK